MNLCNAVVYGIYVIVFIYLFCIGMFFPGGGFLGFVLLWLITPVFFGILPIVYCTKYILTRLLPRLQNLYKIAWIMTLKTIGFDFAYVSLLGLGANLVNFNIQNLSPAILLGFAHTIPIIIVELWVGKILFVLVASRVGQHLMQEEFAGQDEKVVAKLLWRVSIVRCLILAVMCFVWQIMISYGIPEYLWQHVICLFAKENCAELV